MKDGDVVHFRFNV
ncbi:hypothetical protein MTW95_06750 [Mammaliicoccus sciuri]|nr:hypothetical protein [Mammaliicoccus sciuri]